MAPILLQDKKELFDHPELKHFYFRNIDLENPNELRFVAEIDSKIPLKFDSKYLWDERNIQDRLKYYEKITKDDFFPVVLSQEPEIVGFYLIKEIPYPPNFKIGSIGALWVHPNCRNKGIATHLKLLGDNWARERGLKFLQTNVHVSNSKMLKINKNQGYEIECFHMRKQL